MKNLTLIIPAKKEAESLPLVLKDLSKLSCEITVSLDKNDINTSEAIKNYNVKIHEQRKLGYGNSLIEAIHECKTEFFCIFNADGSFEKNDLEKMLNLNSDQDFIFASRYLKNAGSEDDTIITFVGNKLFSFIGKLLFSLRINDILYTYVMGKTKSFRLLNLSSGDFRLCVEFPIKMQLKGLKYQSIPSFEKSRLRGTKKVNAFKDGLLILLEIIKLFLFYKILKKKI